MQFLNGNLSTSTSVWFYLIYGNEDDEYLLHLLRVIVEYICLSFPQILSKLYRHIPDIASITTQIDSIKFARCGFRLWKATIVPYQFYALWFAGIFVQVYYIDVSYICRHHNNYVQNLKVFLSQSQCPCKL